MSSAVEKIFGKYLSLFGVFANTSNHSDFFMFAVIIFINVYIYLAIDIIMYI